MKKEKLKVALLGITHPHTSGRVKALQRRDDIEIYGAADHSELLKPFCDALKLEIRTKEEILNNPDVDIILVHSKSYEMADLTIEALKKGKAVLVEKPAGRGVE
ncbi:Gfo/Idh/MocA family oxidoreductase, partial [Acinetobacter baumannii]|nr:Gfo/Idh/MocA family oxidoreductase [Acinetobacter baumannii]